MMTTTDCARFEQALAEALGSPHGAEAATLAELRRHAASCRSCGGSLDLVDLAGRAASARDPVSDPGPDYWAAFDTRLAARLAAGPGRRALNRWMRAAAAIVVVASAIAAIRFGLPARTTATSARPFPSATPRSLPPVDASPEEADDADAFAEVDGPDLFPGVEDLPPRAQEELLKWLKAEEAKVMGGPA